jgi:hypothetical protein
MMIKAATEVVEVLNQSNKNSKKKSTHKSRIRRVLREKNGKAQ